MPNIEGNLTREERQGIESSLADKMRLSACPICASTKRTLSDMVVTPTTLRAGGGFSTGDPVFPPCEIVGGLSPQNFGSHWSLICLAIKGIMGAESYVRYQTDC